MLNMITNNKWLFLSCSFLAILISFVVFNIGSNVMRAFSSAILNSSANKSGSVLDGNNNIFSFDIKLFNCTFFEASPASGISLFSFLSWILAWSLIVKGLLSVLNYFWLHYCVKVFEKELKEELIKIFFGAKYENSSVLTRNVQNYISSDVDDISEILWKMPHRFLGIFFTICQTICSMVMGASSLSAKAAAASGTESSGTLVAICVFFLLFGLLVSAFFTLFGKASKLGSEARKGVIADNKKIFESIDNVEHVKMVSGEGEESKKVKKILDLSLVRDKKATFFSSAYFSITSWVLASNIPYIGLFIILLLGEHNFSSIGFASVSIFFHLENIVSFYNNVKVLNAEISKIVDSLEDADDLMNSLVSVSDGMSTLVFSQQREQHDLLKSTPFVPGNIIFKNVRFRYPTTKADILKDINFVLERGKSYGISGKNGVGKSTITKTLMKLYYVNKGEITIGERNVLNINSDSLHDRVCFQTHRPVLFTASIAQNVYYPNSCPEDYQEKLWEIAKKVGIDEFISRLPEGFDTQLKIGSAGFVSLSEGQKQQILAMRIFIRDYDIYIFDEILNNISPELKEIMLLNIFNSVNKDSIVIAIDHDYSIFKYVDKVYKFSGDSLKEVELEKKRGGTNLAG